MKERKARKQKMEKGLRMSSWVENWRRPVGLLLNFPLPIFNELKRSSNQIQVPSIQVCVFKTTKVDTNSVVTMQVYLYNYSFFGYNINTNIYSQ